MPNLSGALRQHNFDGQALGPLQTSRGSSSQSIPAMTGVIGDQHVLVRFDTSVLLVLAPGCSSPASIESALQVNSERIRVATETALINGFWTDVPGALHVTLSAIDL